MIIYHRPTVFIQYSAGALYTFRTFDLNRAASRYLTGDDMPVFRRPQFRLTACWLFGCPCHGTLEMARGSTKLGDRRCKMESSWAEGSQETRKLPPEWERSISKLQVIPETCAGIASTTPELPSQGFVLLIYPVRVSIVENDHESSVPSTSPW